MIHAISSVHWSELRNARDELSIILLRSTHTVTDLEWAQLKSIYAHIGEIVAPIAAPYPSATLLPSPLVYP